MQFQRVISDGLFRFGRLFWVKDVCKTVQAGVQKLRVSDAEQSRHKVGKFSADELRKIHRIVDRASQGQHQNRRVILVSSDYSRMLAIECVLLGALKKSGFQTTVLNQRGTELTSQYRELAGAKVVHWDQFTAPVWGHLVRRWIRKMRSVDDLFALEFEGMRVGKSAASTVLRHLRLGELSLEDPRVRELLERYVATGLKYALAARRIMARHSPDLVVFSDKGYNRNGMLFDYSVSQGVDTITWNAAHKSNVLMLKRYRPETRDDHPSSLSDQSWEEIQRMTWAESYSESIATEIQACYQSGDWYSEVGTQFNKEISNPEELRSHLELDPDKKTAVIFPHILWDGTFFWGTDLFASYEEWLVETVKAAAANPALNWVIKIHPANVVKDARDGHLGKPSELLAVERVLPSLPDHIKIISADSAVNTLTLIKCMDFCVTVRGTAGIEAAMFGKLVVTAGTGRYDCRGFTLDPQSKHDYLQLLGELHKQEPPSAKQIELAQRYAWGVFISRPLEMETARFYYEKNASASIRVEIGANAPEMLDSANDLNRLAKWFDDPSKDDFQSTA